MNAHKARRARRIARAVILTRRGFSMYGFIPLDLIADPAWGETHLFAPRMRSVARKWDHLGIPNNQRGAA